MVQTETEGRADKVEGQPVHTREVKPGRVFTKTGTDQHGRPVRDEDSTSHVGAIEAAAEFGLRLYAEAWRRGWIRAQKESGARRWRRVDLESGRPALPAARSRLSIFTMPASICGNSPVSSFPTPARIANTGSPARSAGSRRARSKHSSKSCAITARPTPSWLPPLPTKGSIPNATRRACVIRHFGLRDRLSAPASSKPVARPSSAPASSAPACYGPPAAPTPSSPCAAAASATASRISGPIAPAVHEHPLLCRAPW